MMISSRPVATVAALAVTFTVSCSSDGGLFGSDDDTVAGSGEVVTEEREVAELGAFDRVVLAGEGELMITQGDTEAPTLTIETDDNILDRIETRVVGGALRIETESGTDIEPSASVRYDLTVTDLAALELTGAGSIEMGRWSTDDASVELSGAGDIEVGDLEATGLDVGLPGAGRVGLAGGVDKQTVTLTGVGDYDGADLESRRATVDLSGAASGTVWVSDELDITMTGVGSLDYYGTPTVEQTITGVGTVNALGPR